MTPEQIETALTQLCRQYGLYELGVSVGIAGRNYSTYWRCQKGTRISTEQSFEFALSQVMIDTVSQNELNEYRMRAGA